MAAATAGRLDARFFAELQQRRLVREDEIAARRPEIPVRPPPAGSNAPRCPVMARKRGSSSGSEATKPSAAMASASASAARWVLSAMVIRSCRWKMRCCGTIVIRGTRQAAHCAPRRRGRTVDCTANAPAGLRFVNHLAVSSRTGFGVSARDLRRCRLVEPAAGAKRSMPKKVMIVEDNELNMKLFRDLIEASGYETVRTRNGLEALDLARLHRPDLILMDIQLPEVSGPGSHQVAEGGRRPAHRSRSSRSPPSP